MEKVENTISKPNASRQESPLSFHWLYNWLKKGDGHIFYVVFLFFSGLLYVDKE